jgi:hypothetical protein
LARKIQPFKIMKKEMQFSFIYTIIAKITTNGDIKNIKKTNKVILKNNMILNFTYIHNDILSNHRR